MPGPHDDLQTAVYVIACCGLTVLAVGALGCLYSAIYNRFRRRYGRTEDA